MRKLIFSERKISKFIDDLLRGVILIDDIILVT